MDTKKQDLVLRTGNRVNVRLAAVRALLEINRDGGYANIVLQQYISQYHFTDVDRRFFTELVYGVIRRRNYLDAMIIKLTGRPIKKLSAMVVEILRLGLYQLWYLDRVPHSAAVNESVKLARKLTRGLHGFVNGVLRNSERRREELSIEAMADSEAQRWSYVYNQPEWLIQRWLSEYGEDTTLGLLSWCNDNPALIARVNTLVATPEEVVSEMEKAGWRVEQSTKIPEALRSGKMGERGINHFYGRSFYGSSLCCTAKTGRQGVGLLRSTGRKDNAYGCFDAKSRSYCGQ